MYFKILNHRYHIRRTAAEIPNEELGEWLGSSFYFRNVGNSIKAKNISRDAIELIYIKEVIGIPKLDNNDAIINQ